jgi:hypothetical protein
MLKFKEITKNFFKEFGGNPRAFCCFRPIHHYSGDAIIDNIFVSYNLVEHYFSSFLQKRSNRKCCKKSHYVRHSESREPTKEISFLYF